MANKTKFVRKPLGNFFIKKSLQIGLIMKVVTAALLSVLVSSASLLAVYWFKYNTVAIYMWNQDNNNLQKENILFLILPTLIISATVGLMVALGIGMYASRKFAVPIYKIEQWTSMLLRGQMTAILKFREQEEMKDLSQRCNELGAHIRDTLLDIKGKVKAMQTAGIKSPELESIASRLGAMELCSQPVEIKSPDNQAS
jgi:methyl-accepting chemotaxis protein